MYQVSWFQGMSWPSIMAFERNCVKDPRNMPPFLNEREIKIPLYQVNLVDSKFNDNQSRRFETRGENPYIYVIPRFYQVLWMIPNFGTIGLELPRRLSVTEKKTHETAANLKGREIKKSLDIGLLSLRLFRMCVDFKLHANRWRRVAVIVRLSGRDTDDSPTLKSKRRPGFTGSIRKIECW